MKQTTFEALGTRWWIEIFDNLNDEKSTAVFDSCASLIQTFEQRFSRFKNDSLVTRLNRERHIEHPDTEFIALLQYGQSLYSRTNGRFNMLVGQALEARGYDANYSFKASGATVEVGHPIDDLQVSEAKIELLKGNLDVGGFGKGYLIDIVAEYLRAECIQFFLINAGGDIYATSELGEAITIHLEHPTKPQKSIGTTTLLNQGFAASSPFKRQWKVDDQTVSHIVNEGPERFASYVKADTARDADAFATTALLTTNEELLELTERETSLSIARFSPASGRLWQTQDFY